MVKLFKCLVWGTIENGGDSDKLDFNPSWPRKNACSQNVCLVFQMFKRSQESGFLGEISQILKILTNITQNEQNIAEPSLAHVVPVLNFCPKPVVLSRVALYPYGDIWQCLETVLIVTTGAVDI